MRKIVEVLRLKMEMGVGNHKIAGACKISSSTVFEYLVRFRASGLSWPLPDGIDEGELERKLYPGPSKTPGKKREPDWVYVHRELRRKGVTLCLLWQEYKETYPEGFQYSWFCEKYGEYRKQIEPVMRQNHKFGDKCFVDYAGQTAQVVDPRTGEIREAYLFVGALGASNYSYAEASFSQDSPSWLSAHIRMFEFFGGAPRLW